MLLRGSAQQRRAAGSICSMPVFRCRVVAPCSLGAAASARGAALRLAPLPPSLASPRPRSPLPLVRPIRCASGEPSMSDELAKIASRDALIDSLLGCGSDDAALLATVQKNVLSIDIAFYLRVAARADSVADAEKAALSSLANRTMVFVDRIVQATRREMASSQEKLTKIVAAAAEGDDGVFELPLSPARLAAVRSVMSSYAIDEAVLSNAYAWMRKAKDDGLDSVVELLRAVLQIYAGATLSQHPPASDPSAEALLQSLFDASATDWPVLLAGSGDAKPALTRALAERMERIVLSSASGSYAQRVLAEYCKELERLAKE